MDGWIWMFPKLVIYKFQFTSNSIWSGENIECPESNEWRWGGAKGAKGAKGGHTPDSY
jgi:hypothetical protein